MPFGNAGFRVCAVLVYVWILLGSWVALFPGTLEAVLGVGYDFRHTWGVTRTTFEAFTLGTVLLLLAIGALGRGVGAIRDRATRTGEGADASGSTARVHTTAP